MMREERRLAAVNSSSSFFFQVSRAKKCIKDIAQRAQRSGFDARMYVRLEK